MKIRSAIQHDIQIPEGAILDEVFIGADWKRLPSFKKYQRATPPNPIWNLQGKDLQSYYKSEFMRLASEDKMSVLSISSPYRRSLVLLSIPSSDRKEFIRSEIMNRYGHLMSTSTDSPTLIITDQAKCYNCIPQFTDVNGNQVFQHEVCRHDINIVVLTVTVQTVLKVPLHILNECGEVLTKDGLASTTNHTSTNLLGDIPIVLTIA